MHHELQPTIGSVEFVQSVSARIAKFALWSNDSALIEAGAKPYHVGGPAYWFKWLAPGQYDQTKVDATVVAKSVEKWKDDTRPFVMDLEQFDLYGDRTNALANMRAAFTPWRKTDRNVGWYGLVPEQRGHYWTCASYVSDPTPEHKARYVAWQAMNDANWRDLKCEQLDFLCPSVYAFYKPGQGGFGSWNNYATALIAEAKRLAGDKPVYPFVWPMYHPSVEGGQSAIAVGEWSGMIQHICTLGIDGLIVWMESGNAPAEGWREPLMPLLDRFVVRTGAR